MTDSASDIERRPFVGAATPRESRPAPPRKGFVHVYTGEGKGKTTAAMGLALRASGQGRHVFIGQFMKGRLTGEVRAFAASPLVHVEQFGTPEFVSSGRVARASARDGLARAREALRGGAYDVVVLDEIDVAIWCDLLTADDCLTLLDERPDDVELVLTGRWAPRAVVERADLVTDMREVKHYYRQGIPARAGIEY